MATASGASTKSNGCTQLKLIYKWTVPKINTRPEKTGEPLYSPTFSTGLNDGNVWRLSIYPRGNIEMYKDYISLYLELQSCKKAEVKANFKLSILNVENEETYMTNFKYVFKQKTYVNDLPSAHGMPGFAKQSELLENRSKLFPENKLTILCEVEVPVENENIDISKTPEQELHEDLNNMLENQTFSDVTLITNNGELQAHKAILVTRSSVFAVMFEQDMEERKLNRITITDIDYKTLKAMLGYIYVGKVPNLDEIAADLLYAANKYDLQSLKKMCEKKLFFNLSVGNAAKTLILADLHSVNELKAHTLEFIKDHAADVMKTPAWKDLETNYPRLLADVCRALVEKISI